MTLDALIELPREELSRLVVAADGRPADVGVRLGSGAIAHASVCAASSGGAAAAPCVLVVLREAPEHARALEEIDRIRLVLSSAADALERLSDRRRAAAAPVLSDRDIVLEPSTTPGPALAPAPPVPELTLAQYVSLCVETELQPARIREINERYGLTDETRALVDHAYRDKLAADPALEAERSALHARFRYQAWYEAQAREQQAREQQAQGMSGVLPAPAADPTALPADPRGLRATALSSALPPALAHAQAAARPLPPPAAPPAPQAPQPAPAPATNLGAGATLWVPADARSTLPAGDVRSATLPFKPVGAPELTVEQYAALTVELEAYPERRSEILGMYGIMTETAWRGCEGQWSARLVADGALRQRWMKLSADLKKKLVRP
jgi:hypothetical protein